MEAYYNLIKSTPTSELKPTTEGKCWEYLIVHGIPTNPDAYDSNYHNFHTMLNQYLASNILANPSISHNEITELLMRFGLPTGLFRTLYVLKYTDYNKLWPASDTAIYNMIKNEYLKAMIDANEFDFETLHKACAWNIPKGLFAKELVNNWIGGIKSYTGWEKVDYTSLPPGYTIDTLTVGTICTNMDADKIISNFKSQLISDEYFMRRFMEEKHIILDEFKKIIPSITCNILCKNKSNITKEDFEQWQLTHVNSESILSPYPISNHPALLYARIFREPPPVWMITPDVFEGVCELCSIEEITKTICSQMDADQIISKFKTKLVSYPYFMVKFMRAKHVLLEEFTKIIHPFLCNILCGLKDKITEEEYDKWRAQDNITHGVILAHPITLYIKTFREVPPTWMITSPNAVKLIRKSCLSENVACPKHLYMITTVACKHYDAEEFYTDAKYREAKCKNCWTSLNGLHRIYNVKCPVCFEDKPTKIVVLQSCHHSICTECIDMYLDNDHKCAICRVDSSYD